MATITLAPTISLTQTNSHIPAPSQLHRSKKNWTQLKFERPPPYVVAVTIASIGGLLFGLDTGTIGPVTTMTQYTTQFGEFDSTIHGLIVSTILIPAAAMSFFAGHLADKIGRTRAIMLGSAVFGIGAAIEAAAVRLGMFIAGRAIKGLGEGAFLSVVMVYAVEVSPPHARGPLGSVAQFMTTLGICMGFFICYGTVNIPSSMSWRLPMVIQAAISFALAVSCAFLPPSPRWLLGKGRRQDAYNALDRLGMSRAEFEKDLDSSGPETGVGPASAEKKAGWLSVFSRDARKQTALGAFLMGMAQLSGIDGVLYYAPILFQQAGLSSSTSSFLASGVSALLIMLATIPASIYADRWSRRSSAITGGIALAACMLTIGSLYASQAVHATWGAARWVVIVAIYLFAISYSTTWAVSFRVYATEIQPARTRAPASSLSLSANWCSNFLVALTTPIFLAHSAFGAYFLFGFCSLFTALVCLFFMPETRGRTLDQINNGELSFNMIGQSRVGRLFKAPLGKRKDAVRVDGGQSPDVESEEEAIEMGVLRSGVEERRGKPTESVTGREIEQ